MSIGPNSSKPIFPSWEQVQQKIHPPFGTCMCKLFTSFKEFGQKVSLQNLALFGGNMSPPKTPISADAKIPSLIGGRGK
jgi:hypothetical protein